MPYRITQCYLLAEVADTPDLHPAEAGTRLSDPGRMLTLATQLWPNNNNVCISDVALNKCLRVRRFGRRNK